MVYFCADDYGLKEISDMRIQQCIDKGALNKVSVFPNFGPIDFDKIKTCNRISLHLNLVEGKCMADADGVNLIADKDGNLKHTFGGLFKLNLFRRKAFEAQVYKEIKAQVLFWKNLLPDGTTFCIDSHQHTHMIPAVFKALIKVLNDENINLEYMRIPAEPVLPYIKTPSLYLTYSPVNIIKQWLLKLLWQINKSHARKNKIPTAYFMGILFSGKMDEKRVSKILPEYIRMAEKKGGDTEVLFHPGYVSEDEIDVPDRNVVFKDFYESENRKTEFDSVIKLSERGVS